MGRTLVAKRAVRARCYRVNSDKYARSDAFVSDEHRYVGPRPKKSKEEIEEMAARVQAGLPLFGEE